MTSSNFRQSISRRCLYLREPRLFHLCYYLYTQELCRYLGEILDSKEPLQASFVIIQALLCYAGCGCPLLKLAADAIWKCLTNFTCRIVAGCLMRTATYVSNFLRFKSTKPVQTVSSSGTAQRQNRRRLLLRRPVT
jgi:hypothetical protein